MKRKNYLINTSRYDSREVQWLIDCAVEHVLNVARLEGWADRFEEYDRAVLFTNTEHARCGRSYWIQYLYRVPSSSKHGHKLPAHNLEVRRVLVRIGSPHHFPMIDRYSRYKDMPEMEIKDWCEAAVSVIAHEFSHTKYSGNKEGEFNCELIAHDAVMYFRKNRHQFELMRSRNQAIKLRHHQRKLAAKTPEVKRAKKLMTVEKHLLKWERKLKLATTKVKKYRREWNRINRSIAK